MPDSKQVMHGIHKTTLHSGKVVSGVCSFLIHYGVVENLTALFTLKIQQSEEKKKKKSSSAKQLTPGVCFYLLLVTVFISGKVILT